MKTTLKSFVRISIIWIPIAALSLAGCDSSPDDGAAADRDTSATQPRSAEDRAMHTAEGTVNSIDRAGATVNISHGPVESADWPAMTMSFKLADPDAAGDVAAGQRVEFQFTIESGMSATVTRIAPAE